MIGRHKETIKQFITRHAEHPAALTVLGLVSAAESIFFPIPTDVFLISYLVAREGKRWLLATIITTLTSVLGGVIGYLIGFAFYESVGSSIIETLHLTDAVASVGAQFQAHTVLTIFIVSLTPIPYKVFAIASGLFEVSLPLFILASLLGRGVRFGLEGYLLHRYGPQIAAFLYRHANIVSIIVALLAIALFFVFI